MAFSPLARYRNVTVDNLKSILEVYPDMVKHIPRREAVDLIEKTDTAVASDYKKTASQLAGQLGLEDRSLDYFRVHNYLYTFSDEKLFDFLVFWFKTYYAPNPRVISKDNDEPFILYVRICEEILKASDYSIKFSEFFKKNIAGKSADILLNAIIAFGSPIKSIRGIGDTTLYINKSDLERVKQEIQFILNEFSIPPSNSEHDFFERYSYYNFCKFYNIEVDPKVKDGGKYSLEEQDDIIKVDEITNVRDCAFKIINVIYEIDRLEKLSETFQINDSYIKINPELLGGNYLRDIFARSSSKSYNPRKSETICVITKKDFDISVNGVLESCRLTSQWKKGFPDDKEKKTDGNYLDALIKVVNDKYQDVLNVYKSGDTIFVRMLAKDNSVAKGPAEDFKLQKLPEIFRANFAKRYITSLLAKPFVILAGNSGTGKTRIAKQFAEYLEVECHGGKNWALVPVGADWTDNTRVMGFYNPLADEGKGRYEKTEILKLIERANENRDVPFFLILDEMNLSHVERYFADFLSHMETPDLEFALDGYDGYVNEAGEKVETLRYPSNLFVVGTVNIDETTYMFSPKVLDRANVIEFSPDKDSVLSLLNIRYPCLKWFRRAEEWQQVSLNWLMI